jgi:hypothetical protein
VSSLSSSTTGKGGTPLDVKAAALAGGSRGVGRGHGSSVARSLRSRGRRDDRGGICSGCGRQLLATLGFRYKLRVS